MRKFLSLVLLTLIFNFLYAYENISPSCNSCLQGLEFSGEFLWWQGKTTGLYIEVQEFSLTDPFPYTYTNDYWEFGYSPGFRLGLSYQPYCWGDIAGYATFTHFRATDTQTLLLTGTADINYVILFPFFSTSFEDGEFVDYTGTADLLYNRLDVGLAKYCLNYGCLSVVPKIAFTYAHTRTSVNEDAFLSESDLIVVSQITDSYSGYGATVGFDANYRIGSALSFYSSFGFSGLWGPFQLSYFETDTTSAGESQGVGMQNQSIYQGRWITDIQIGLQYQSCICGCYQIAARLGWEFLTLGEELNFGRSFDPAAMNINGLTAGLAVGF